MDVSRTEERRADVRCAIPSVELVSQRLMHVDNGGLGGAVIDYECDAGGVRAKGGKDATHASARSLPAP